MGAAAIPLMLASSAVAAVGSIEAGQAQAQSANYQAEVARMNATISQQNAAYATQEGQQKAYNQQAKTRADVGAIVAAQGANNLDVNSGSDQQVQTSAKQLGMQDTQTIENSAARESWNFESQSAQDTAQTSLYSSEASSSQLAGFINAGGSILGGASSAAMFSSLFSGK